LTFFVLQILTSLPSKLRINSTHQLYTGFSRPTAKCLDTGLPLTTAKILTAVVTVTLRRISSTSRHSTNICAWRKYLSYI